MTYARRVHFQRRRAIWHGVCGEGQPGAPLLVVHGDPGFLTVTDTVRDLADVRPGPPHFAAFSH